MGPLERFVAPRTSRGELRKLSLYAHQGHITVIWRDDPAAPTVEGVQGAPPNLGSGMDHIWGNLIGDQSAWIWKQTKWHIASDLRRLVQSRQLPNEILMRETIWGEACARTVRSAMHEARIPIDEILKARPQLRFFHSVQDDLFQEEIGRLQQSGAQFLDAPYPQADRARPASAWITSYFTAQRIVERARAVYGAALQAYKQLVLDWFPKFAPRLTHFAILPVQIHGILIPEARENHPGQSPFTYRFDPLPQGSQNEVSFEIGSVQQARDIFIFGEEHLEQMKRLRPQSADWLEVFSCGSGLEEICQNDPCTRIVYNWLESDLREVNWDQ